MNLGKLRMCFFLLVYILTSTAKAQNFGWHIKPTQIVTPWAQDVRVESSLKEYPRPQMQRRKDSWINLNGLWQYKVCDTSNIVPSEYDGTILVPFPIESALSGVKKQILPSEALWYKRVFKIFKRPHEKILLHFGAVDWRATVMINKHVIGTHEGGYNNFSFDLTEVIKSGENEIVVKVWDPTDQGIGPHGKQVLNPGNIYYTPSSGIWQTVWLETVPEEYISELQLVPDIDNGFLNVYVNASWNADVQLIARDGTRNVSKIKGKAGTNIKLPMKDAKLWSPETPFLYDLTVRIMKENKIVDEVKSYFGMRKISIQKDGEGIERIFLNNKEYFNLGTLDQGFWPDGLYTAPTDAALKFDIESIKAMGFNTIRKHIKVEPARWYYHADKIGMLVWQDFVNPNQRLPEGAKGQFEEGIKATVNQLYNYPSIITWVIFNERWGQYNQQSLTEFVKSLDKSRLVNGHSGELLYVEDKLRQPSSNPYVSSDMSDVHSYPFPRNPISLKGKVKVVGEFGGIGVPIEGHIWDDLTVSWGYSGVESASTLRILYERMMDSLIALKEIGLSASIYTQPFDVESEQNGLITYDRKNIKIPLSTIRIINSRIKNVAIIDSGDVDKFRVSFIDTSFVTYAQRKEIFYKGISDSVFLRRLSLLALANKDSVFAREVSSKFLEIISDKFSELNIKYISKMTFSVTDPGFDIFFKNRDRVNNIAGKNYAEMVLRQLIYNDKVAPHLNSIGVEESDWQRQVISSFGDLGEEIIWSSKMVHYFDVKEWKKFGIYYKLYFDRVLPLGRNVFHINNMSWPIFENISDTNILNSAINAMRYNIERFDGNDPYSLDTYANLLYKMGNKNEALVWEEKALKLSNNDKLFKDVYDKMLKNEPTWR